MAIDCHWTIIGVHGSVTNGAFSSYQSDPPPLLINSSNRFSCHAPLAKKRLDGLSTGWGEECGHCNLTARSKDMVSAWSTSADGLLCGDYTVSNWPSAIVSLFWTFPHLSIMPPSRLMYCRHPSLAACTFSPSRLDSFSDMAGSIVEPHQTRDLWCSFTLSTIGRIQ